MMSSPGPVSPVSFLPSKSRTAGHEMMDLDLMAVSPQAKGSGEPANATANNQNPQRLRTFHWRRAHG